MDQITRKIPVTIITGFLGAGKTTFINQILKQYSNTKFALVENEFGDASIDTELIKGVNASQMFELKNGCICCTITNEFELTLQELAERFPDVEHLLIETTGIADPAQVIAPFFQNNSINSIYEFNGSICIADALHFYNQPEINLRNKQLATSDLIILNKSEDIDPKNLSKIKNGITAIAPLSSTKNAVYGEVDNFTIDDIKLINSRQIPEFSSERHSHSEIDQKTIITQEPFIKEHLFEWLKYNLDIFKKEIYRIKGILYFKDEPFEYILQGIGGSFEIIEGDMILNKSSESKIVIIGKLKEINFDLNVV